LEHTPLPKSGTNIYLIDRCISSLKFVINKSVESEDHLDHESMLITLQLLEKWGFTYIPVITATVNNTKN